ncbi:MAG: PaaI family thioesterase [Clostridia bacterium]|nr:PaaI family thioesterase [Clostridia bacterium]
MEIDSTLERFLKDNFAVEAAEIKIVEYKENYAKCKIDVKPVHLNGDGVVMGGVLYTLADYTFAIAGNYKRAHTVSLNGSISFLSPANSAVVYAEAEIVKDGKSTCVGSARITDGNGKLFAVYSGTGFRKSK